MSRASSSILLLLVAMTSIQFGASFAKQIFDLAHPAGITMLRTSLAAVFLLALCVPGEPLGIDPHGCMCYPMAPRSAL